MKTFSEIIEMSIAGYNDWDEGVKNISPITKTVTELKWNLIETFNFDNNKYEFRKLRSGLKFVLGSFQQDKFYPILQIAATRQKPLEKKLDIKNLINIDGIAVLEEVQGRGIAKTIYKYLVNKMGYNLLGDETQYFGARKLWARLSNELDIIVSVVDMKQRKIIQDDIYLQHGKYESDFDKKYWSRDKTKKDIRFILTKIY